MFGENMAEQTVPNALEELWNKRYFVCERTFQEIKTQLGQTGFNPSDQNLHMGLSSVRFLTQRGRRGHYRHIQKYSSDKIDLNKDFLPDELVNALEREFGLELRDLKLNFGRSGTCTAFLLRKILEKLIFLTFAKNGFEDKLKDKNGEFVGLKTMLNMATIYKVHGKPFLMPKTAKEIEGIKFLGDTSAHNPLVNVSMSTIIPMMPFIVTAYSELSILRG